MTPPAGSRAPGFADRLRGVLFDAGNTLLWIDHARIARLITEAGHAIDTETVREAEIRARPRLDPLLGKAPKRESPHVFRRHIAYVLDHAGVQEAVVPAATEAIAAAWPTLWVCPPDDAHATLRTLRARGYAVGCLSNSNGKVDRLLAEAGLLELLDVVVDSGSVGIEKPDPRIFTLAAEQLGMPAGDIAYVGDLHALDVLGPRAAGMHAILLDPVGAWAESGFDADTAANLSEIASWLPGPPAGEGS